MRTMRYTMLVPILAAMLAVSASFAAGSGDTGSPIYRPYAVGCYQSLPFILGGEKGGDSTPGWGASPWAFGSQSCNRGFPLYFGAQGYGFPFTLGNIRISMIPSGY